MEKENLAIISNEKTFNINDKFFCDKNLTTLLICFSVLIPVEIIIGFLLFLNSLSKDMSVIQADGTL